MQNCFIENCEDQVVAKGMCNRHYLRHKRSGTTKDNGNSHASLSVRFFRKVDKTETCWVWTGNTSRNGYGSIQSGGKGSATLSAHRLSYEMHKGQIPNGYVVMHSCDNPSCVNPDHLSVGTFKENTADMIGKGRKRTTAPRGADNGKAKLNDSLVRYIRQSGKNTASIARELSLSANCIRSVRTGRTWSHVK
jgi:hypothetical protein